MSSRKRIVFFVLTIIGFMLAVSFYPLWLFLTFNTPLLVEGRLTSGMALAYRRASGFKFNAYYN